VNSASYFALPRVTALRLVPQGLWRPAGLGWAVAGRRCVSPATVSARRGIPRSKFDSRVPGFRVPAERPERGSGMHAPLPPLGEALFETGSHRADGGSSGRVKSGNFMPNSWLNSTRAGRIIWKI